jgi:20S proteasome subunit beta 7
LAQPILRRIIPDEAAVETITQEQAVAAVKECMKVLFYRDARSLDKYSIATITREGGVALKEDEKLKGRAGRLRKASGVTVRRSIRSIMCFL